ncbi:UDP-glucosyltransferase 2-like [Metopolophium dirhodum]|uniref:UDP-glucosyltransferase 2-like n=1 Tax=Metopolophium dirhodum TaxID=44670 RepID=UPI00299007C5|nr:UDP-glucosyltransferase 2-like [Metopolophium dirhodum]
MVISLNNCSRSSIVVFILFFTISNFWILPVENARILAVETLGCKSHWNFMSAVLRSLTDTGHSVTVFTPLLDGDRDNYTEVDLSNNFPILMAKDMTATLAVYGHPIVYMNKKTGLNRRYCDSVYGNRRFNDVIRGEYNEDFDVIIMEPLSVDCMSYLASTLNLPIIYVIPSPMITYAERTFTGHISNPAVVSNLLAQRAVPKTFVQRAVNTGLLAYSMLITVYDEWMLRVTDPKPYDLSPKVHPSIIFQNSHYITESSRPVLPNLVDVGGIHLKPPKSIPQDVLDFIEDSPHGVIYFTFGSIIQLSSLPEHIIKSFKEAFANVPQRVLWKYEGEMKDVPKNVMIKKWFSQRDILLHPKIKLFISHGGISGVYEALDGGVPVLGFPLFFDQPRNIDNLVTAEMAISMDLFTINKEKLLNNILQLVNNEKYMKNAKIASQRFKDRPMSPEQSVVYWTEYVIRHKGAPHLKSHGLNLTWYQYFLLDVIAVILTFIILVLFIIYKLAKFMCEYTSKYSHSYVKVKTP